MKLTIGSYKLSEKQRLIQYRKPYLWRQETERKARIDVDGYFVGYRVYRHVFFNAKIRINEGLFWISKENHIKQFCDWVEYNINRNNKRQ